MPALVRENAEHFKRHGVKLLFRRPVDDLLACVDRMARGPRPLLALAASFLAMGLTWFLYVPVHELLHVLGCVATGGTVSELQIQPIYGGALLAELFPFVVAGGEYAGRLSDFDTHGSDLVYLATDFAPFLLSVLIGVPAMRQCARRARPFLFGAATVLGLAPFYSIPGDYYEMGSILTTRALTWATGGGGPPVFEALRSDDLLALIGKLVARPAELGLGGGGEAALGAGLIALSTAASVLLAFSSYALGGAVAGALPGTRSSRNPAQR
jgi:hypothetical protein